MSESVLPVRVRTKPLTYVRAVVSSLAVLCRSSGLCSVLGREDAWINGPPPFTLIMSGYLASGRWMREIGRGIPYSRWGCGLVEMPGWSQGGNEFDWQVPRSAACMVIWSSGLVPEAIEPHRALLRREETSNKSSVFAHPTLLSIFPAFTGLPQILY